MNCCRMNEYQRAVFNIEEVYPATSVCNLGGIMHFKSEINSADIFTAANIVLDSLPIMRLRISKSGDVYISSEKLVISERSFESIGELKDFAAARIRQPFELYDSPLFEGMYLSAQGERFGFIRLHHILGDHSALLSYFKRLERAYDDVSRGTAAAFKTDMRYIDTMLNGDERKYSGAEYFKERFSAVPYEEIYSHPGDISEGIYKLEIDPETAEKIPSFCKEHGIKPESVFYAALAIYLNKTKGIDTSIIGGVLMNRDRYSLDVFGLYANTIPIFIKSGNDFIKTCIGADRELKRASAAAAYPLNRILSDNSLRGRCFDIAVSYISMGMLPKNKLGEITSIRNGCTELPLRLHIYRQKKKFTIEAQYMSAVFKREYIAGMLESVIGIIESGINGAESMLLSRADIEAYETLNTTETIECHTTISRLFSKYTKEHANNTAFIYNEKSVSFAAAENMARTIAGAVRGSRVTALVMQRSEYLIPAMLGIMKAGAAYMPVKPGLEIPKCCDTVLSLSRYNIPNAVNADMLDYDNMCGEDFSEPTGAAYYMQTSGSSGNPKVVMISHKSLYLRLMWMHKKYGLNRRILQKTSNTFDVSGWELLACAFGGECILMPNGGEREPDIIAEFIEKYHIEVIHFVPSMLRKFVMSGRKLVDPVHLISSGEALDAATVGLAGKTFPNAGIHNLYGPTECTIDVSYYDCDGIENEVPIGKPTANTKLYIVNGADELMPRGIEGELVVTGDLVGMGYYDGIGGYFRYKGHPAYRTGDICKLGFDAQLYYVCRRDKQVKINGKRIDLEELRELTMELEGVDDCAVTYDGGRVYLFYCGAVEKSDIRSQLGRKTDRMPSCIFKTDTIPTADTGKTDTKALLDKIQKGDVQPPFTEAQRDIHSAVMSELNSVIYDELGINENIFDVGIDSLSVLSLKYRLGDMGYEFSVQDFYSYPTIKELGELAEKGKKSPIVYLKNNGAAGVLCCFPYAGGQPRSFELIAEETELDTVGVDYDSFDDNAAVGDIAREVAERLLKYESIALVSACIGSAFAIETAYVLESMGRTLAGVYIIAGLPVKAPGGMNPWRRLNEGSVSKLLKRMGGRDIPQNIPPDAFLRDTDRFFKYMHDSKRQLRAQGYIALADGDRFTAGYKRKSRRWRAYFVSKPSICVFNTQNHYFFETEAGILNKMIGAKNDA